LKAVGKVEPKPGIVAQEVEEPEIGESQVLVEIKATTVSGSGLHIYRWDEQAARRNSPLPMTVGHELSDKVVQIGKGVKSLGLKNLQLNALVRFAGS